MKKTLQLFHVCDGAGAQLFASACVTANIQFLAI